MNIAVTLRQSRWNYNILQWLTPMMNLSSTTESHERNNDWFAQILRSQRSGHTCLPYFLGLNPADFNWLLHKHLCPQRRSRLLNPWQQEKDNAIHQEDLRQQLLEMRDDEWQEIRQLLRQYRAGIADSELLIADIVAAACLGGEHLWRDLGLSSRNELSALMNVNFPRLAGTNTGDMKWKKFFYKQLCEAGGGYVCRAPSCDQCTAYDDCFGSED
ncbi:nitrogen fixation protein NifQ [Thalassolituus sp.]|jgi:nitrogen fixation protein NifQ|uniref:nitrogen fixation protein NifQ n=1 Tax=Thalassolituus sp. TaxID=2030822 RepID=UPI002A7F69A2|nr:nitrogen fixation protein NifQ [Thalassolituus sp.]|tara:strand:- start:17394 stop:18038 length:645 start_codon:yes stop_codon:yes gene_type:complete